MFNNVKRMAGILLAMMRTRAELAAVEIEEELQRLFGYLMLSLIALFCFGIAVLLGVLLIIILFWESHRIAVVIGMMGFFLFAAIGISMWVRNCYRQKPRFLAATMDEFSKDIQAVRGADEERAT